MASGKQHTAGIVDSTALLSKTFSALFADEPVVREVAFNLADMEPELLEIHGILQEIKKTGKATGEQVGKSSGPSASIGNATGKKF